MKNLYLIIYYLAILKLKIKEFNIFKYIFIYIYLAFYLDRIFFFDLLIYFSNFLLKNF